MVSMILEIIKTALLVFILHHEANEQLNDSMDVAINEDNNSKSERFFVVSSILTRILLYFYS